MSAVRQSGESANRTTPRSHMNGTQPTPSPTPDDAPLTPPPHPLVFSYTRAQAIHDGVLIDVSATAKEAGFVMPVAVTAAVWGGCVGVPDGVGGQGEAGGLWDVLHLLRS